MTWHIKNPTVFFSLYPFSIIFHDLQDFERDTATYSYTMSGLTFYNYPGVGEQNKTDAWYSQAVRIGDRIECSGQGKLLYTHSCSSCEIPNGIFVTDSL